MTITAASFRSYTIFKIIWGAPVGDRPSSAANVSTPKSSMLVVCSFDYHRFRLLVGQLTDQVWT